MQFSEANKLSPQLGKIISDNINNVSPSSIGNLISDNPPPSTDNDDGPNNVPNLNNNDPTSGFAFIQTQQATDAIDSISDPYDKAKIQTATYLAQSAKGCSDQTNRVAAATAQASAQCQIIVNVTCNQVIEPPKSTYNAIVQTCRNSFTQLCFNDPNLLPSSFWVSPNGGTVFFNTYIILRTNSNILMGCSNQGKIVIFTSTTITNDKLWMPVQVGKNVAAFKSYYGGYLTVNDDGKYSCSQTTMCDSNNYFDVILSSNLCANDTPNYVALRSFKGYVSLSSNSISTKPYIYSANELFVGYNYDFTTSNC